MKSSRYNILVNLGNGKTILYNTYSRKYIVFKSIYRNCMESFLSNLDNIKDTRFNRKLFLELISKKIIVRDSLEELEKVRFQEYKAKYQSSTAFITVQTTLDCNFRCSYCWQEHEPICLDDNSNNKLIKYVDKISKKSKNLKLIWFGGEPLVKYDSILNLTSDFKKICEKNNCNYISAIVTNGYLLDEKVIANLHNLNIKYVQVTLDGSKKFHDAKRHLANGKGTYDVITNNLIKLINEDIILTLRVNIDKENYSDIDHIFNIIPMEYRDKVILTLSNIFQNEDRLDLYHIYKKAIENGYRFNNTVNTFFTCETCNISGITIEPDCKVTSCSIAAKDKQYYGYINDDGNFVIDNEDFYISSKKFTASDNYMCKNCISLPMCVGGCKYYRYKNPGKCTSDTADCLNIEEKIKLHYYNDFYLDKSKITEVNYEDN